MLKSIISLQTEETSINKEEREEEPLQERIVRHEDQSVQPLDISQFTPLNGKKKQITTV